jgi:uncharacterized protein YjbI with pentapeptide repeats
MDIDDYINSLIRENEGLKRRITMNATDAMNFLNNTIDTQERRIKEMEQKNSSLTKVVATIRTNLERAIKGHAPLNQAVYDAVDLCRANFQYFDYSNGQNKIDPPLTDAEKILP